MENTSNELLVLDGKLEDAKILKGMVRDRYGKDAVAWKSQWLKLKNMAHVSGEEAERQAFIEEKIRYYTNEIVICEHRVNQHACQTDDPIQVGLKGYMIIFDVNGSLIPDVEKEIFPGNFDAHGQRRQLGRSTLSNKARKSLTHLEEQLNYLESVQHIDIKASIFYGEAKTIAPNNCEDKNAYYCTYEKMGWVLGYWFLCEIC